MIYKSFYFLHVPRTGGKFVKKYLIDPISEELKSNGIDIIENEKIVDRIDPNILWPNDHVGWNAKINPDTYVFSIFREPISWGCSYFTQERYWMGGATTPNTGVTKDSIVINKDEMLEFFKKEKHVQNFQSKNFVLTALRGSIMAMLRHGIPEDEAGINKDFVLKRLNRVNLLVRNKDLNDPNKIIEKIESDLGIKIQYRVPNDVDMSYNGNDASRSLFASLSNFERDIIASALPIDIEIYNSDIFWSTR